MVWVRRVFILIVVLVVVTGLGLFLHTAAEHTNGESAPKAAGSSIERVEGSQTRVRVHPDVFKTLRLRFANVEAAQKSSSIRLNGTLGLDPNRLARVHARFEGQVTAIGRFESDDAESKG